MFAAAAASNPKLNNSIKCFSSEAPPQKISGKLIESINFFPNSKSNPKFDPSLSIEFTNISPQPLSSKNLAQSKTFILLFINPFE